LFTPATTSAPPRSPDRTLDARRVLDIGYRKVTDQEQRRHVTETDGKRTTRVTDTDSPRDPGAVLFDIDGTLVDSTYLHINA
jgi:hypothetical protein